MAQAPYHAALKGSLYTVVGLIGGLALGFVAGSAVFNRLPGHSIDDPNPLHIALAAIAAFGSMLIGCALWGVWMGGLAGNHQHGRLARAGMLGFAPITLALALFLQWLEPIAASTSAAQLPIHRVFTLLFVPCAFLISGVGAWVLGRAVLGEPHARTLFWQIGLAGGAAFLGVDLFMEALGWQVGGPNAAARNTMLTVMFAGNLAAALVGGGLLGWRFALAPRLTAHEHTLAAQTAPIQTSSPGGGELP
jgi:hypothetical protein